MDQTVTTRLNIPLTPDTEGRLDRAGLVLAGLVVAVGVEDAFLWGGRCPVRYRRLVAEVGGLFMTVIRGAVSGEGSRIRTGPHMRCGGAGRDGAVMWQPRSTLRVWPPEQVFDLRPCDAAPTRRGCGTTVVTAWRWTGGTIPTWTPTGSRSATTTTVVRCRPGSVSRAP